MACLLPCATSLRRQRENDIANLRPASAARLRDRHPPQRLIRELALPTTFQPDTEDTTASGRYVDGFNIPIWRPLTIGYISAIR